ncbi:hypothetical protein AALP_AAs68437U000100 [Arabis alpina]|uniref:Acidic protein n=1 Tax=Arabis alpina TaxID=50452 RepID=A0A087G0A9_ARAAL|nr:hypothetical protein AALP_AAs68437U000100 [Arabis alpina]
MSMVMVQIQVEAKSCCPSSSSRNIYNTCRFTGAPRQRCASISGCQITSGGCPSGFPNRLKISGDVVNDFCKLGCASSVCGTLTSRQAYDPNEIVNEAVEQCNKACSTICTKDPMTALEIV